MKKRMIIMLIGLGILFGGIAGFHLFKSIMIKRYMAANAVPVITVSSMKAGYADWQPRIAAVGSLRAVNGVSVTTEMPGLVDKIYFQPGAEVKAGDMLVQLNADSNNALLHSLQANAELAELTYKRDQAQFKAQAISRATLDADAANLKSLNAQVAQQAAIVAQKTIRAPFAGRLGISEINPGQYLNPGDKIVTLQTLNPIYVDFFVPQQSYVQLKMGQAVKLHSDAFPDKIFQGKITTINPAIDATTRNVEVEATIENEAEMLTPGMFANVEVDVGAPKPYITLPQAAISFNPYGEIVYIVEKDGIDPDGRPLLKAQQSFVTTGETRGDQITILKGIKAGDEIVTSGQLKLKNGSRVVINNSVQPANDPNPAIQNEG